MTGLRGDGKRVREKKIKKEGDKGRRRERERVGRGNSDEVWEDRRRRKGH